jgi:hypothetical protein
MTIFIILDDRNYYIIEKKMTDMGIRLVKEDILPDPQIEDYQFVDEIDKDILFEQLNPNGQYNFSGALYLYWSINLSSNTIDLEIKGQSTGE